MSDSVHEFIRTLLKKEPQAPHTVELEVDTDGDVPALFEVLISVFTGIMSSWYPSPIKLASVTSEKKERVEAYFKSFGIDLHFTSTPLTDVQNVLKIDNNAYLRERRLEDMNMQIMDGDQIFKIAFGFARRN
jgi:hypothetical protein